MPEAIRPLARFHNPASRIPASSVSPDSRMNSNCAAVAEPMATNSRGRHPRNSSYGSQPPPKYPAMNLRSIRVAFVLRTLLSGDPQRLGESYACTLGMVRDFCTHALNTRLPALVPPADTSGRGGEPALVPSLLPPPITSVGNLGDRVIGDSDAPMRSGFFIKQRPRQYP